jgi:hypothetical protein
MGDALEAYENARIVERESSDENTAEKASKTR